MEYIDFIWLFMNSELDYFKFYKTIPTNEAYALLAKQLPGLKNNSSLRTITSTDETQKMWS
jgi:hypothetical protein